MKPLKNKHYLNMILSKIVYLENPATFTRKKNIGIEVF